LPFVCISTLVVIKIHCSLVSGVPWISTERFFISWRRAKMAANISFKQQCPSCEAMVTIRDDSLIGKKIDCPKCKYRFVVEEPAEEEDEFEEEEAPPKKKGKAVKGKAGKRRDDDDDDDDDRPRGKKEGGSKKLVLGLVIGGAALLPSVAAGGVFFINKGGR